MENSKNYSRILKWSNVGKQVKNPHPLPDHRNPPIEILLFVYGDKNLPKFVELSNRIHLYLETPRSLNY